MAFPEAGIGAPQVLVPPPTTAVDICFRTLPSTCLTMPVCLRRLDQLVLVECCQPWPPRSLKRSPLRRYVRKAARSRNDCGHYGACNASDDRGFISCSCRGAHAPPQLCLILRMRCRIWRRGCRHADAGSCLVLSLLAITGLTCEALPGRR